MSDGPLALTGLPFDPQHPATRIYVQGYQYKLVRAPVPRLPLANTVKVVANWIGPAARLAKNIYYLLFPTGVDTTIGSFLQTVANSLMSSWSSSGMKTVYTPDWKLSSITCHDNSGLSSATGTSTSSANVGTHTGNTLPPQTAVCLSWVISASYRGGKPRWYIPGIPDSAVFTTGDSGLGATYTGLIQGAAAAYRSSVISTPIATFLPALGTISYQTGHAPRPTPLFRAFTAVNVHERLDSQRRRSGKESAFGELP